MSRFCWFFPPRQNTEKIISRIADKSPTKQNIGQAHGMSSVRRVSPLPNVRDRLRSSPASFQAMTGCRKCRASRELPLSSRPSRLTDIGEINTKSPAIFLSWTALSRDKLSMATLARHGRPSRSQGTSSSTIKRIPFARTSGFDDSIRCTSVTTSWNMIIGPHLIRVFVKFLQNANKKGPLITTLRLLLIIVLRNMITICSVWVIIWARSTYIT